MYVSRTIDQGASFEPFVPVSAAAGGQSEAQLRPTPDGSSVMALWMAQKTIGDSKTKAAMSAVATAVQLPDLNLSATGGSFAAGGQRTLILNLMNQGTGNARNVKLAGSLPDGLTLTGISDPSSCSVSGSTFSCTIPEILFSQSRTVSVTVTSPTEGSYVVTASVNSDDLDADATNNKAMLTATAAVAIPAPAPIPAPGLQEGSGGGCTAARAGAPFDPILLVLASLGVIGMVARRVDTRRTHRRDC